MLHFSGDISILFYFYHYRLVKNILVFLIKVTKPEIDINQEAVNVILNNFFTGHLILWSIPVSLFGS